MGRYSSPTYSHGFGHISVVNSSNIPLSANGIFLGTVEDVLHESVIVVSVFSDVTSATDGLEIQFSSDNVNWEHKDNFTISANTGKTFSFQPVARYFRIKYTNGTLAQSEFRLHTVFKSTYVKPSSHRIADSISDQDDAELVKAVLSGEDPDNHFHNVSITHDGYLAVSDQASGLSIARGQVSDASFIHKFGNAPDFDTADNAVTIWDGAEDGVTWENMVYDYSATAIIDSASSSDASDTEPIEIQGLDADYNLVNQTVTLNGQTRVALTTNLIRVFRIKNVGTSDLAGHVFVFEEDTLTGGVPDDASLIRAIIHPPNNQTLMAVYTIPAGYTGYMRSWYAAVAGASKTSNYVIDIYARPFGQVFQLKHRSAISDTGSSHVNHHYVEPEVFSEKTDIEMKVQMLAAGATGASVSAGFDIVLIAN
jgi:hypothetical protein